MKSLESYEKCLIDRLNRSNEQLKDPEYLYPDIDKLELIEDTASGYLKLLYRMDTSDETYEELRTRIEWAKDIFATFRVIRKDTYLRYQTAIDTILKNKPE